MPYKKGQSGNLNGRPKGVKNKFRIDVPEMFESMNFNPLKNLMQLALRTDDDEIYFQCNKELAQYFAPKLKTTQFSTAENSSLKFSINIGTNDADQLHLNENSHKVSS